MENRVRFAPSPTGKVHVGNIRTAIFNYLFARHTGGKFLLRVEDTDRERSTQEAIDALLECMEWLGLEFDEEIMYQSQRAQNHIDSVNKLIEEGKAYKAKSKDGEATPTLFKIPFNADNISCIREVGEHSIKVHPDETVIISDAGVNYAQVSKKGKPIPELACLAGFKSLKVYNDSDELIFDLDTVLDEVLSGEKSVELTSATKFTFIRREVFFDDLIKGELAKPLDTIKDLVIVRSDGSPVFHIANVCDDVVQKVTHIVRGDDHVENTYRHILLFEALDYNPPQYAHLPMIVNKQGKPYSKRDGDAFVGDFRAKGFMSEALFNYLTLLGWSPGDDREKMTKEELISSFELERVKSSPAQLDLVKLQNLNGLYIADMPFDLFIDNVKKVIPSCSWSEKVEEDTLTEVAKLMQSRTKSFANFDAWSYFFTSEVEYDRKTLKKALKNDVVRTALSELKEVFISMEEFNAESINAAISNIAEKYELGFKLNQPLRVAVTGIGNGADLFDTLVIIGKDSCIERIGKALNYNFETD
jgi:glutamyl-tRNA synthetase